ncbi:siderophore-interacting protein [Streptomyces sp. NPDC004980]
MTTSVTPADAPYRFFGLTVLRTGRLSPSLRRITFGGPGLDHFASGGRDQNLSLFLPRPGRTEIVVPVDENGEWFAAWRALPEDVRAIMRSYTVHAQRRAEDGTTEIDIDFALHEDGGPACRWAEAAAPGDQLTALGPAVEDNNGIRFHPPRDTLRRHLVQERRMARKRVTFVGYWRRGLSEEQLREQASRTAA